MFSMRVSYIFQIFIRHIVTIASSILSAQKKPQVHQTPIITLYNTSQAVFIRYY